MHEKIILFDIDLPIEKIFKIHSITIVIKSLIEKDNEFYLELALNHCLYENYYVRIFLEVLILISAKKHLENAAYVNSIIS